MNLAQAMAELGAGSAMSTAQLAATTTPAPGGALQTNPAAGANRRPSLG